MSADSVEHEVRNLNEKRMNTIARAREILERASSEKRELTHEESANHDKAMDDISRIDKTREALVSSNREWFVACGQSTCAVRGPLCGGSAGMSGW